MAEYIDNHSKRQQVLKRLIQQLHQGATVEDVKSEFARLLTDVGASEIAEMEQALISEGIAETEVKRLCDVHVAVFQESLEAQSQPESVPGHPVHTFRAENEAVGPVLDALQDAFDALAKAPGMGALRGAPGRSWGKGPREVHPHGPGRPSRAFAAPPASACSCPPCSACGCCTKAAPSPATSRM